VLCGPNLVRRHDRQQLRRRRRRAARAGRQRLHRHQGRRRLGPDGIATTRAEGPDLLIKVAKSTKINIGSGDATGEKTIKLEVSNVEFGRPRP
jgi:hypothetical protein